MGVIMDWADEVSRKEDFEIQKHETREEAIDRITEKWMKDQGEIGYWLFDFLEDEQLHSALTHLILVTSIPNGDRAIVDAAKLIRLRCGELMRDKVDEMDLDDQGQFGVGA